MTGLSCPLGIARSVPAKAKFFGVIFWPYNKSFIDQACLVKMAGYWPGSFLCFYGHNCFIHKNAEKEVGVT